MIPLKNKEQIAEMRNACRITAEAMQAAIEVIREGVSTLEIDRVIRHYIERRPADISRLRRLSRQRMHQS